MASNRQIHLGAVPYGTGGPGSPTLWLDPEIPGDASVSVAWFADAALARSVVVPRLKDRIAHYAGIDLTSAKEIA